MYVTISHDMETNEWRAFVVVLIVLHSALSKKTVVKNIINVDKSYRLVVIGLCYQTIVIYSLILTVNINKYNKTTLYWVKLLKVIKY